MKSKENKNDAFEDAQVVEEVVKEEAVKPSDDSPEAPGPIEPERVERIMAAERLSIKREILEALVGFVYEFMEGNSEMVGNFNRAVEEANNAARKKRKVSINIKEFKEFMNNIIKFMLRMQGTITTVQKDIDAEGYKTEKQDDGNLEK